MRAAALIRNGLPWIATNTDLTLPTGDGPAPGHGVLVRLISEFAERGAGGGRQAGTPAARRDACAGSAATTR